MFTPEGPYSNHKCGVTRTALYCLRFAICLALLFAATSVRAQQPAAQTTDAPAETEPQQDVGQRSLPLRTALHHDPSLDAPFERLVVMYREAGRMPEIIDLYRQHTTTYPADPNGAAVLLRLLDAHNDSQSLPTARALAAEHKTNAYLQFLQFQALQRARQAGSLDALEQAIALSNVPRQKAAWIDLLLAEAASSERPQLIDKYLKEMAGRAGTPAEKLDVAQRMSKLGRQAAALTLLEEAAQQNPPPEIGVQIELAAAAAEVASDRTAPAAARLDRLLERLAPDYWGRNEIVRRRLALVTSEEDRKVMIGIAKTRLAARPTDESAALDLAQLLIGFEHRREALAALLESGRKIPASERIEKLTLELLDRLHDERARQSWLAERIKTFPDRTDLVAMHVRSLLVIGNRVEARRQLDKLIKLLPAAERVPQQLELARSLNKSNLSTDAAEILQRVVDALPERFDLRRELAEWYLKLGNRSRARELFAASLPDSLEVEHVLDFVPFLIQQEMFVEARRALLKTIKPDDANIDLRLLLADADRRTGNRANADKVLTEARTLADTPARYKLWIEAAATLHQEDETLSAFIAAEQQRLTEETGPWNEVRVERILALLEIAGREKSKVNVADLAAVYLADGAIPPAIATKIREQLVRTLDKTPEQSAALAAQLQDLIDSHPDDADEYRARLALLYIRRNEHHLAEPLLGEVRVAQLKDVTLLADLEKAYGQFNQSHQVLAVLERLTTLEPANKSNWEAWLYHLAMIGREERFRDTLRQLLAGVNGLSLEEPVKRLLLSQLIDSYGRSILANLNDGRAAPLSDALTMLATTERLVSTPQQAVWLTWNRAFILNRLQRIDARDEAIGEMERILAGDVQRRRLAAKVAVDSAATNPLATSDASTATPPIESAAAPDFELEEDTELRLRFPDGLSLSLANARRLLTQSPHVPDWPKADSRTGPMPNLTVRWAIDLPADRPAERLLLASATRLYVVDAAGTLSGIDVATGKVLWETEGVLPVAAGNMNLTINNEFNARVATPLAAPVLDQHERLYFGHAGEVTSISGQTGQVLWRSTLSGAQGAAASAVKSHVTMPVFLRDAEVIAFDAERDTVAVFAGDSGKLLWSYEIGEGTPLDERRVLHWMNTGATFDGERLFVYGRRTALVNFARREVEWAIEPERARKLPVRLDPTSPALSSVSSGFTAPMSFAAPMNSPFATPMRSYPSAAGANPMGRYVDYQRRTTNPGTGEATRQLADTSLVGPAAIWSASSLNGQPRFAMLHDNRLMLCSHDRMSIMDIDLPITGRNVNTVGTYLGCVGHLACFLRTNEFFCLDLVAGGRRRYALDEVTGGLTHARTQAVIDGPLVYLTGPRGVVCLNLLAGKRVFYSPWPAGAELPADDPRWSPAAGAVDQGTHYLWNGMMIPLGPSARCVPSIGAVSHGVLYTAITPWRIVAIGGAAEP